MVRARTWRGVQTAAVAGALCCMLEGCFAHKRVQTSPVILARQTTVPLAIPPEISDPPLLDSPKQTKLPPVPVAEAATKPKRTRRKARQAASAPVPGQTPPTGATAGANAPGAPTGATGQTAPVQVAGNSPALAPAPAPGDTVIGALTPGGADQSPQVRQDAQELLASTDRRLSALPAQTLQTQRTQVSQIRNFWKQGSEALKAGDAEGAKTLALKAKLLLDDLEKAGQ